MSRQPTILSIGDINLIVPSFVSYAGKFEILSVFDSHVIGYVHINFVLFNRKLSRIFHQFSRDSKLPH